MDTLHHEVDAAVRQFARVVNRNDAWVFEAGGCASFQCIAGGYDFKSDFAIEDTWFNVGLRGTGSNNVVLAQETFVPAHRTVELFALREGTAPGGAVNPAAAYRTPMMAAFGLGLVAPALGIVRGALDS